MTKTYKTSSLVIKKLFKVLLILLAGYFLIVFVFNKEEVYKFTFQRENLKNKIEKVLQNEDGRYGIFIKNLSTNETFLQNEHQVFESGSLYKIWVMAAVFEKIKDGEIKEEDELITDVVSLNEKFEIDSENAELKEGKINFSIKSAIFQMIAISHNYAALALIDKVGRSEIQDFLQRYGLNESSIGIPPKTSAWDIAKFFEKLYHGEIIDQDYSQKMLDILSEQKIDDRIPKYLPKDIKIAHKTGDIGWFEHDGGIVYTNKGNYIIVILSESNFPPEAQEKIALLSKAVYDYFNAKVRP